MLDFGAEGLWSQGYGVALDVLVDGVVGKLRFNALSNLDKFAQGGNSEGLGVVFPVVSFGLKCLLEGIQFAVLGKRAFQVLGQGNIKLVEATESVEFLPEGLGEGGTVTFVAIYLCTDVEEDAVNLSILEPDREVPDVGNLYLGLAFRMLERVEGRYSFIQTSQGFILVAFVDTEVEVLEEVGLTGAVVAADPDTIVADGFVADGAEK